MLSMLFRFFGEETPYFEDSLIPSQLKENIDTRFPSFLVYPAIKIKDEIHVGKETFDPIFFYRPSLTFKLKWLRFILNKKEHILKRVYLIPFDKERTVKSFLEQLALYGKKPCQNSPWYLLGLMSQYSEKELASSILGDDKNNYFLAGEIDNPNSVFYEDGRKNFLLLGRTEWQPHYGCSRDLGYFSINHYFNSGWSILAEDI